jgi:hypothetical protein
MDDYVQRARDLALPGPRRAVRLLREDWKWLWRGLVNLPAEELRDYPIHLHRCEEKLPEIVAHARIVAWLGYHRDHTLPMASASLADLEAGMNSILKLDSPDLRQAMGAFSPDDILWARDALRAMPFCTVAVSGHAKIPVAHVRDATAKQPGGIAYLALEVLRGAADSGHCIQHPGDHFFTAVDDVAKSLAVAWNVARNMAGEVTDQEARWRLLDSDGEPMAKATGASASGAAAIGWARLLAGQIVDVTMIILGDVNTAAVKETDFWLLPVEGIDQKLTAVTAPDQVFDTIVVAAASLGEVRSFFNTNGYTANDVTIRSRPATRFTCADRSYLVRTA